jgi:hypothetical protein
MIQSLADIKLGLLVERIVIPHVSVLQRHTLENAVICSTHLSPSMQDMPIVENKYAIWVIPFVFNLRRAYEKSPEEFMGAVGDAVTRSHAVLIPSDERPL